MMTPDGETITRLQRRELVLLVDRPEIAITWTRYAPGEPGPGLHVHREHTDAFYVLEGELIFRVGPAAEPVSAPAGTFVAVPPNVVHTFANDGSAEACWLNFHAPDTGFAAYLRAARDGVEARWDSFDPPADGGRPAAGAIVSVPGEGERLELGDDVVILEGVVPALCVAEWDLAAAEVPRDGAPSAFEWALERRDGRTRVLTVHAPDGGFAESLRRDH